MATTIRLYWPLLCFNKLLKSGTLKVYEKYRHGMATTHAMSSMRIWPPSSKADVIASLRASTVQRASQTHRRRSAMKKTALLLMAAAALFATSVAAQETIDPGANVSVVFDQELPNVSGKSLRAVLVEYEPGAGSPSHRHPSSAFIYARVLEGSYRSN